MSLKYFDSGWALDQERRVIERAQRGSRESRNEVVLRHVPLVAKRVQRKVFPKLIRRHGEDLVAASVPMLCGKVATYDLRHRDKQGNRKPVPFAAYVWKRIDGFIIDFIKRETARDRKEVSGVEFD